MEWETKITRRDWIKMNAGMLSLALVAGKGIPAHAVSGAETITIGLITDVHYADRASAGTRYYRDSLLKLQTAVNTFNEQKPAFCVELGDFVDKGDTVEMELAYLKTINSEYAKFKGDRYYVIGNHDVATFTKKQFLENCGIKDGYHSFDHGAFHFVILDGCYKKDESDYNAGNFDWQDSNIPAKELEWLESDLKSTSKGTVIFIHQRLDDENSQLGVKNAALVRDVLEKSGKVLAVFHGHDHNGAYNRINGIHYFTFKSLVDGAGLENNSYSLAEVGKDNTLNVRGFGKEGQFLGVQPVENILMDRWGRIKLSTGPSPLQNN